MFGCLLVCAGIGRPDPFDPGSSVRPAGKKPLLADMRHVVDRPSTVFRMRTENVCTQGVKAGIFRKVAPILKPQLEGK